MSLDPGFDVVELEPEMTAETVVGDGIAVPARRASIDEGFRHADQLRDLLDVQVARAVEELKLLRPLVRLFLLSHAATSYRGSEGTNVARAADVFQALLKNEFVVKYIETTRTNHQRVAIVIPFEASNEVRSPPNLLVDRPIVTSASFPVAAIKSFLQRVPKFFYGDVRLGLPEDRPQRPPCKLMVKGTITVRPSSLRSLAWLPRWLT